MPSRAIAAARAALVQAPPSILRSWKRGLTSAAGPNRSAPHGAPKYLSRLSLCDTSFLALCACRYELLALVNISFTDLSECFQLPSLDV
eukprot:COSAG02_NODE_112_length_35994_cov_12.152695_28_plen_89_part_00